LSKSITTP